MQNLNETEYIKKIILDKEALLQALPENVKNIKGVCEGCGGILEPIETVNNAGKPTFWIGCEKCSKFRVGIETKYFEIARKLVEEGYLIPYSHMHKCDYENNPERLEYWLESQTAGISHTIKYIDKLLQQHEEEK